MTRPPAEPRRDGHVRRWIRRMIRRGFKDSRGRAPNREERPGHYRPTEPE